MYLTPLNALAGAEHKLLKLVSLIYRGYQRCTSGTAVSQTVDALLVACLHIVHSSYACLAGSTLNVDGEICTQQDTKAGVLGHQV